MQIENYTIVSQLSQNKKALIFSAVRDEDQLPVILKKMRSEHPLPQEIAAFRNEYALIQQLSNEGVIKAYDLFSQESSWVLVLEDIKGNSLKSYIHGQPIPLGDFFKLSLSLVRALAYIHSQGIIHKDIKPANILISPTQELKIIDFSIASTIDQNVNETVSSSLLQGTLEYISPEQTGRINRVVQFGSDLYSLGITFYEMLTGKLPFVSEDFLELIYAHLSKIPPDVHAINPQIPVALSSIVNKLIAKDPENRYQTAQGLLVDLEKCAKEWEATGSVAPFPLARHESLEGLKVSSKLYGREKPLQILRDALAVKNEKAAFVFISGYSGIGKTSLIKEIEPDIIEKRGLLIEGKFDQLQHHVPYFALAHGLKKFIRELLIQSEERIRHIRESLQNALKPNAQLIIDLIPELEWILGPQPAVPSLPPMEAQTRFYQTLSSFLQSLATPENPLILCLDDMQWADLASIEMLQTIIPEISNILFIGIYRSNEVDKQHPLKFAMDKLKDEKRIIQEIVLEPLSIQNTEAYLKEIFSNQDTHELCEEVYKKTLGNPFFLKELIRYLGEQKLFYFDSTSKAWVFDLPAIQKLSISQNVVDLMRNKLHTLTNETQEILGIAAALGVEFQLTTLAEITQKKELDLIELLLPAAKLSLLSIIQEIVQNEPERLLYKFCHDKIQQAAYELLPLERRPHIHYTIAKFAHFLEITDLTNHYNQALNLLTDQQERHFVMELNLEAARKAKEASAYQSSLEYLLTAEKLALLNETWETNPDLLYSIYYTQAESYFLIPRFEKAAELFNMLLERTDKREQKAHLYLYLITLYMHVFQINNAVDAVRKGLALYGIHCPKVVKDWHLILPVLKIKFLTMLHDPASLEPMQDKDSLIISEIISTGYPALFQRDQKLASLMALHNAQLNLKYGYTKSLMSLFLISVLFMVIKDYKTSKIYYDAVYKINAKIGQADDWGNVLVISGLMMNQWFDPLSTSFEALKKGIVLAREKRSHYFANAGFQNYSVLFFRIGTPLFTLEQLIDEELIAFSKDQSGFKKISQVILNLYRSLSGRSKVDEELLNSITAHFTSTGQLALKGASFACFTFLNYTLGEYQKAHEYAKQYYLLRDNTAGTASQSHFDLFCFLSFAKLNKISKEMRTIEKDAKAWAKQNPENFLGFYQMMCGERLRIEGKYEEAIDYLERAETNLREENWLQYAATAEELLANVYEILNRPTLAKFYRQEAHYRFALWEAFEKTRRMERLYPELQTVETGDTTIETGTTNTSTLMDYLSVLKATQSISEEIVLENLLKRVITVVLENTGAQRAALLIDQGNQLFVRAEGRRKEDQMEAQVVNIALAKDNDLPQSLIAYVQRVEEHVLVNSPESQLFKEPYFSQKSVKAAFCLPIRHQGRSIGIIYLEHYLNAQVFNTSNLKTLNLILTQVAISLENAQLYATYRRFVPQEFLKFLGKRSIIDIDLGNRIHKKMTVLFTDIRGFTGLSEILPNAAVFELINEFLGRCSPIIRKHGGFVDKYVGDAIIGLFPEKSDEALLTAQEIAQTIKQWNASPRATGLPRFQIGIGIHTGNLVLGIIGEEKRLESSVLGDTVRIASHIENLNKAYNTTILFSGATQAELHHPACFQMNKLDSIHFEEARESIDIWKLQ